MKLFGCVIDFIFNKCKESIIRSYHITMQLRKSWLPMQVSWRQSEKVTYLINFDNPWTKVLV